MVEYERYAFLREWEIACNREATKNNGRFRGSRESGRVLRESSAGDRARLLRLRRVCRSRPSCSTLPKVPMWSSASRAHTLSSGAPPELSLSPRRDASRRRDAPTRPPRRLTPSTRASSTTAATTVVRCLSQRVSRTKRTTAGLSDCSHQSETRTATHRDYWTGAASTSHDQKPVPPEFTPIQRKVPISSERLIRTPGR